MQIICIELDLSQGLGLVERVIKYKVIEQVGSTLIMEDKSIRNFKIEELMQVTVDHIKLPTRITIHILCREEREAEARFILYGSMSNRIAIAHQQLSDLHLKFFPYYADQALTYIKNTSNGIAASK